MGASVALAFMQHMRQVSYVVLKRISNLELGPSIVRKGREKVRSCFSPTPVKIMLHMGRKSARSCFFLYPYIGEKQDLIVEMFCPLNYR